MKNFKRILALVMVFCTVAAWMIPGVTAADTPASLTVDFATAFTNANVSNGTYLQSTTGDLLNAAYETNKWTIYCGDGTTSIHGNDLYAGGRNRAGYLEIRHNNISSYGATVKRACTFIAPGTGDYVLSVSYGTASTADNKVVELGAYILPMPETAYTKYTIPGPTSESILTKATKTEPYSNGSVAGSGSGAGTFSAENTVSLVEGQEYMIIFYGVAADTTNAYAHFTGFALNPVVKYDYSVTYHANYEGAEVETVADNENVTGSIATALDITADANPFSRPATFLFEGWATTPDGLVEYKAGDTINLTSENTSIDLYAIWREVWDPANNTDLSVNFKNDFTAAGVASNAYLVVSNTSADLLDAAYAAGTIKWTTIRTTQTGTVGYNATSNGGRFRAGNYLEVQHGSQQANYAYAGVPLRFKAPGTGEYRLSFTYGKAAAAENGGTLIGAYITNMPEEGTLTRYTNFSPAGSLVSAVVENPGASGSGVSEGTVVLEGGKEYMIAFFAYDSTGTKAVANFVDFTLTEVKPEASIGSTNYATVEEAVAEAVSGNTIKLGMDADVDQLNLPAGVTLNLNGKTLTAAAFTGILADSTDGDGRLAVAASDSAVVTSANGQVALWDNTADATGYRVFNYTFSTYGNGVYGSKEVTGVDVEIDFYDYERNFLATSFDEYGEVAKGAGDYKFYQTLDNGNTVLQQIKADYEAGNTDWRFEYSNQQYQMGRGGVCFSWGNKSIRQFGAGYMAVRFEAPADGKVNVTLKTSSAGSAANDAGFSLYILKASDVEALYTGESTYEALHDEFVAAPATAVADLNTTIQTAYGAADPVLTGVSDGNAYTGAYEFEADVEYIAVFLNNGSVSGALHMNFQNIHFTRNAVAENAEQTFWSVLEFTNANAYNLVASEVSGLKAGFDMVWEGADSAAKDFALDDALIADWAETQAANAGTTYGFYIRVSGFAAVGAGELTATPYICVGTEAKITSAPTTYEYTAE